MNTERPGGYVNPYLGGALLGVVLFASFIVFGHGLGASGGLASLVAGVVDLFAPGHVDGNGHLAHLVRKPGGPLDSWLVFELLGVAIGGFVSGLLGGRVRPRTHRGPRITVRTRVIFAFLGGSIAGFGVRLSRGCTSGQALSGGAVLSAGSWAFMFAVFAGAYAAAYFVRRLWI